MSAEKPDLTCREVVELVTDYLEHALPIETRNRLEQHLVICNPCVEFIAQHRSVARALSALAPLGAAQARAKALDAFRKLRAPRSGKDGL